MKLKKGKHYLLMHPETAKDSPLEIMTNKFMNKGEITVMNADAFKNVTPTVPDLPVLAHRGLILDRGPIVKVDPA